VVWRGFVVRFNIVCGAVLHGLWCASVLVSVMFRICRGACGKGNFKRRRRQSLKPFFYHFLKAPWLTPELVSHFFSIRGSFHSSLRML
jgi:hypothetical protein